MPKITVGINDGGPDSDGLYTFKPILYFFYAGCPVINEVLVKGFYLVATLYQEPVAKYLPVKNQYYSQQNYSPVLLL